MIIFVRDSVTMYHFPHLGGRRSDLNLAFVSGHTVSNEWFGNWKGDGKMSSLSQLRDAIAQGACAEGVLLVLSRPFPNQGIAGIQ